MVLWRHVYSYDKISLISLLYQRYKYKAECCHINHVILVLYFSWWLHIAVLCFTTILGQWLMPYGHYIALSLDVDIVDDFLRQQFMCCKWGSWIIKNEIKIERHTVLLACWKLEKMASSLQTLFSHIFSWHMGFAVGIDFHRRKFLSNW